MMLKTVTQSERMCLMKTEYTIARETLSEMEASENHEIRVKGMDMAVTCWIKGIIHMFTQMPDMYRQGYTKTFNDQLLYSRKND